MANGLIAEADFKALADHIAYQWLAKEELGPTGEPMAGQLDAAENLDLSAAGLINAARIADQAIQRAAWSDTVYQDLLNRLVKHLGADAVTDTAKDAYAGIDAYLTGEAIRVHRAFAEAHLANLGTALTKTNVYDDAGITLGTINWSGSGTGALTDGTTTDTANTGGNSLRWRIPTGKSVTSSSVTLVLTLPDGTTEEKTVTISGSAGDVGSIGTLVDDVYTNLVSITVNSGGANGNQVVIETVCDRAPALIA